MYSLKDAMAIVPTPANNFLKNYDEELSSISVSDLISSLVLPRNAYIYSNNFSELLKEIAKNRNIPLQIISQGASQVLQELDELRNEADKHESIWFHIIKSIAHREFNNIVKAAFRVAFRLIVRSANWVFREVIVKGIQGMVEWVVRPMLMEILGFIGINPELWPIVAVVGGAVAVGYGAWDMFFSKEKTPSANLKTATDKFLSRENTSDHQPQKPISFIGSALPTTRASKILQRKSVSVDAALIYASSRTGVPVAVLTAIAARESSFNANATTKLSNAKGLFQFVPNTWRMVVSKYAKKYGIPITASPMDPVAASVLEGAWIRDELLPKIKEVVPSPTATDLYMAHFLGIGDAKKFLIGLQRTPNALAALKLPVPARSNPQIFYWKDGSLKTYSQIYSYLAGVIEPLVQAVNSKSKILAEKVEAKPGITVARDMNTAQSAVASSLGSQQSINANKKGNSTYIRSSRNKLIVLR